MPDSTNDQDFASVLATHDKGRVNAELSKALTGAVDAVRETGKPATVTLKVKVASIKDLHNALRLDMGVTHTIPRESSRSIWYADDDAKLHRTDPRQQELDYSVESVQTHRTDTPEGNAR